MVKKKKEFLILPFIVAILSMAAPLATAVNLQNSDVLYIALLGAGISVWKSDAINGQKGYFLFLILGMMTSYFDFLTYPLVSLGIPLVIYISSQDLSKTIQTIFRTIINSIGWAVGYVGMWLSKGILGSLLFPDSKALETGIGHFFMRSSGDVSTGKVSFLDVVIKNMFTYLNWPIMVLIALVLAYMVIKIIIQRNFGKNALVKMIPYVVVLVYPFAWFMVMRNHSYIHTFVYRNLAIATFAGLSALSYLTQKPE